MNTEHLQQCADAGAYEAKELTALMAVAPISDAYGHDNDARIAFAQAAISTYIKLNPVWVRASERMPTREDADRGEWVVAFDADGGFDIEQWDNIQPYQLWCGLKGLPPPPDPFEDWLAQQPDDVRSADKELVRKIYNSIKP